MTSKRQYGFTLIELMIVVAVIAVLVAIAYPAYSRYGYRARRSDGQEFLLRIAAAQERYYATFNRYGGDPVTGDLKFASVTSDKGYYTVAISSTDLTQSYTATVTPVGVQAKDACGALSIDSSNNRTPLTTDATKNSNGRCW